MTIGTHEPVLAGPVATSGVEGLEIAPTVIADLPDASADSIVGAPTLTVAPPSAGVGEVILAVLDPWYLAEFSPGVDGLPTISRHGTAVSFADADKIISIGAANSVQIVKR